MSEIPSPVTFPVYLVVWISVCLAVVLGVVFAVWTFRKYLRIMVGLMGDRAPGGENGIRTHSQNKPRSEESILFTAADGQVLRGFFVRPSGSQPVRGVVVFAHEFSSTADSCYRYCKSLIESGYEIFSFDFRGHGCSPSLPGYKTTQWPTDREKADMAAAIRFASDEQERVGRSRSVGVFGMSRGAGAAILAAVESPDVVAVITDGLFCTDTTIEYLTRRFATVFARIRFVARNHPSLTWRIFRWLLLRECSRRSNCKFLSVRRAISKLGHRPLLMIHGAKDSFILVSNARELAKRARCLTEFCVVPGAKHNCSVFEDPALYAMKTKSFFDKHLAHLVDSPAVVQEAVRYDVSTSTPTPTAVPAPAYSPVYSPSIADHTR